jgi:hypothetical protein
MTLRADQAGPVYQPLVPGQPDSGRDHPAERDGGVEIVRLGALDRAQAEAAVDGWLADQRRTGTGRPGGAEFPDDADFFDAAEIAEGILPEVARAALVRLRHGATDAVVLRGLPADIEPGPTPRPGVTSRGAAHRGRAWIAMAVRRLGGELAYAMEKNGAVVHDIFPTREGAQTQSNASWQVELNLHTENAFHPVRPDFVVLCCVRAPRQPPATRLALLRDLLPLLSDHELAILRQPRFTVHVTDSFRAEGQADLDVPLAALSGSQRWPVLRWHDTLRGTDEAAERLCTVIRHAAAGITRQIDLHAGDLLAFANDRCLHGRDRFDTNLDGQDRWLLRSYVLRDPSRIRRYTAPGQPLVVRLDLSSLTQDADR